VREAEAPSSSSWSLVVRLPHSASVRSGANGPIEADGWLSSFVVAQGSPGELVGHPRIKEGWSPGYAHTQRPIALNPNEEN
jgi:hypothetical protein